MSQRASPLPTSWQPEVDCPADEPIGPSPPEAADPVVEAYKEDVDRTLLRQNLELTPAERAEKFVSFARFAETLADAGRRARSADPGWGLGA
jgi:hypothetical protein